MSEVNVLVVFYSRYGETEKLALAAGVGALQARANIRLRRLRDLADQNTIEQDSRWKEALVRMSADYIAPRNADAEWADVLILAAPEDTVTATLKDGPGTQREYTFTPNSEMVTYLQSLKNMNGKFAAVLVNSSSILKCTAGAGFTVVPIDSDKFDPTGFGTHVCQLARSAKAA